MAPPDEFLSGPLFCELLGELGSVLYSELIGELVSATSGHRSHGTFCELFMALFFEILGCELLGELRYELFSVLT